MPIPGGEHPSTETDAAADVIELMISQLRNKCGKLQVNYLTEKMHTMRLVCSILLKALLLCSGNERLQKMSLLKNRSFLLYGCSYLNILV